MGSSRHLMADHVEICGHRKAALLRDIDCEVLFDKLTNSHQRERQMSAWDPVKALELARTAVAYVAYVLPPDATLETMGRADKSVLKAEEHRDFDAYAEALRKLCRVGRCEARRRAA